MIDRGKGEALAAELDRYRFRVDVVIEPLSGEILGLWGPSSRTVLDQAEIFAPDGWERRGDQLVATSRSVGWTGFSSSEQEGPPRSCRSPPGWFASRRRRAGRGG